MLRRSSGSGYEKPQSGYALCAVFLRHIFAVAGTLRVPLSQPQKRRIQPATAGASAALRATSQTRAPLCAIALKFFGKFLKKHLTKKNKHFIV
jgi:hypothetical protein